jgi:hypothetical protein
MITHTDDEAPTTRRVPRPSPVSTRERHTYLVEITYREPGYALHSGTDRPYSGRFVVQAAHEDEAVARAKAQFEALARASSVGWVRVIERVTCRQGSDP